MEKMKMLTNKIEVLVLFTEKAVGGKESGVEW